MKKLNDFNDFLFDKIFEGLKDGTMSFVLSDRLYKILNKIDHPIAHHLLDYDGDRKQTKETLIDIDNDRADMFTYITSPKLIDYYQKEYEIKNDGDLRIVFGRDIYDLKNKEIWLLNRSSIKIGRFINKLFPDIFPVNGNKGKDIESFVDEVKSERTKQHGKFKIVKGDDIIKYYNSEKYESGNIGSTLVSSCMSHKHCGEYLEFYAQNKNVELVLLMSEKEEDKIIGRALLWTLDELDDEKVENRKFMDRIYYVQLSDIRKFKELAIKNKWLYKDDQNMHSDTWITDTIDGTSKRRTIKVKTDEDYIGPYPYMDTLKYYNKDEHYLINSYDDNVLRLESTGGGFDDSYGNGYIWVTQYNDFVAEDDMLWSEVEGRYLTNDDAIWIESMSDYVSQDYAQEKLKYSDTENKWLEDDDAMWIDSLSDYVSNEYAMENYIYCDYDNSYYDYDESYPSERWGGVPHDKAIRVFINTDFSWQDIEEDGNNFDVGYYADWRYKGDDSYFTLKDKQGNEYHFSRDDIIEKEAKKKLKEKEEVN